MLKLSSTQHRRDVATPADLSWPNEMDGNTAIGKPTPFVASFERFEQIDMTQGSPGYIDQFLSREFWRFVLVQQRVAALAGTAIEFSPMQKPASFNLQAVKEQVDAAVVAGRHGQQGYDVGGIVSQ
jgi:arylsulfatase